MPAPHRVVIAVFPGVDLLDATGPAEVFALADREAGGRGRYEVLLPGAVEALRRVVRRRTGSAPAAYRRSFRTAP
ncbi:hypothetical protein [Nocardiopsis baichengensis]|uniref:hypothetical protein n=1 Tax=Nocardiopsis baichengensis TaxID=280240 RepID=UPI0003480614|nr:hypothetical protein [Nocardiopsis baichengensis]